MFPLSIILQSAETEKLRARLEALYRQTQPTADFETIVVTSHLIRENFVTLGTRCSLRVIQCISDGFDEAYKLGVEAANGRYRLFLGEEIIAGTRLVEEHLRTQQEQRRARDGEQVFCLYARSSPV